MKKIIVFLGCVCLMLQASAADQGADLAVSDEQTAEEGVCGQKGDHEGFYGAVGLGISHAKLKSTCVEHELKSVTMPNPARPWGALAARPAGQGVEHAKIALLNTLGGLGVTEITSLTFAANGLDVTALTARGAVGKQMTKGNADSVGGWLALGYGHLLGNGYIGAELSCDLGANKDKSGDDNSLYAFNGNAAIPVKLKQSGVIPSVGVRFGFFIDQVGTLLYVKCGAAWSKLTLTSYGNSGEAKFCSPLVALGCEKKVGLVTVRGEVEYRKGSGKKINIHDGLYTLPVPALNTVFDHSTVARVKSDAWTVRLVVTKHINSL